MRNKKKKKLGCCGYDELAYKPPTTRPLYASNLSSNYSSDNRRGGFGAGILYPISNLDGRRVR